MGKQMALLSVQWAEYDGLMDWDYYSKPLSLVRTTLSITIELINYLRNAYSYFRDFDICVYFISGAKHCVIIL